LSKREKTLQHTATRSNKDSEVGKREKKGKGKGGKGGREWGRQTDGQERRKKEKDRGGERETASDRGGKT